MSHASACLTPMGWLLIIQRIQGGKSQAHVAAQMSLSLATVAKLDVKLQCSKYISSNETNIREWRMVFRDHISDAIASSNQPLLEHLVWLQKTLQRQPQKSQ